MLPLLVFGDSCSPASGLRFYSQNKQLENANGERISLKGLNWWGTEGNTFTLGGLNTNSMSYYLDILQQNGFNALRIPFALDMALNPTRRYPTAVNSYYNPTLVNVPAINIIDQLFQQAAARGIMILLDQHHFDSSEVDSDPAWFTTPSCINNPDGVCKQYTYADDQAGWDYMINRYKSNWNFLGIDLINEPHGFVRWGGNIQNPANDYAKFAQDLSNYLIAQHPDWSGLFFVEGNELNPTCEILGFPGCETCGSDGHWWGGNLEGVRCEPLVLTDTSRLVYSPHVYGPSVYNQPYFQASNFPSNLPYIYDTHFGFVMNATGRAVIIGEWGGPLTGNDLIVQTTQSNYFKSRGIDSTFYWALNPNPGGDTDGLFNPDWTPNPTKMQFLANAHPNPTAFSASGTSVCMGNTGSGSGTTGSGTTTGSASAPTPAPSQPTTAPTTKPATPAPSQPTGAPSSTGNIKAQLNSGTNAYWLAVVISNDGGATKSVSFRDKGSYTSFTPLEATNYGAWIISPSTALVAPIDIQVTSTSGVTVTGLSVFRTLSDTSVEDLGGSYSGSTGGGSQATSSPVTAPPTTKPATPAPSQPTTKPATPVPSQPTTKPPTPAPSQPTTAPTTKPATPAPSQPTNAPSASDLTVSLNSGSNAYWLGLLIGNDGGATSAVSIRDKGSYTTWTPLAATNWGAWILSPSSAIVLPLDVRATSSTGKTVTALGVVTSFSTTNADMGASYSGSSASSGSSQATSPPASQPTAAPTTPPESQPTAAPTTPPASQPTAAPTTAPSQPTNPPASGGSTMKFTQNSGNSAWWFGVAVLNNNQDVSKVELKDAGSVSSFTALTPQAWGYWTYSPSSGLVLPVTVRATSVSGSTVSVTFTNFNGGSVVDSNTNFA